MSRSCASGCGTLESLFTHRTLSNVVSQSRCHSAELEGHTCDYSKSKRKAKTYGIQRKLEGGTAR
jgi:hypothetical protein